MHRLQLAILSCVLIVPLFFLPMRPLGAAESLMPLIPSEVKVLVVSPANIYHRGAGFLVADLVRYGFNVTQDLSDAPLTTNYLNDPETSDLTKYQVVILHGCSVALPPVQVSLEEVNHFVNYGGILIVIGDALLRNETTGAWWNSPDPFSTAQIQRLGQRLGVNFGGFFGDAEGAPYGDNNGTFTRTNSMAGLPSSLTYDTSNPSTVFQLALTALPENTMYDFTSTSGTGGKTTAGVTFYRNATGAVGIYIQGSYVRAEEPNVNQINYFGLSSTADRAQMLASLIAHARGRDIQTIIKPNPLATIRLGNLGGYGLTDGLLQDDAYLSRSLEYFNSVANTYGITPTVTFTDQPAFKADYWQAVAPNALSQLRTKYRDWEYASSLRNQNITLMTEAQIEALIENIQSNHKAMGLDLFSTVVAPLGIWNDAALSAMMNENLALIEVPVDSYQEDWNLQVNSGVLVHKGSQMASEAVENFTQMGQDILGFQYFSARDKWAIATLTGFPEFVFDVRNFAYDQVGTYSLSTICQNLVAENPDIRFVSSMEAGLYYGNRWMKIVNPTRNGSTIEFDVDASNIPEVVGIGKGMLWLSINSDEAIREVSLDGESWYYYDANSIRLPTSTGLVHVKISLGVSIDPRVAGTAYKVVGTMKDSYRFVVSVVAGAGSNVTIWLFLPNRGVFYGSEWNVFCSGAEWNYAFDELTRVIKFWGISSGGTMTFQIGPDVSPPVIWYVRRSLAVYNDSVTITANITDLQTNVSAVILNYFSRAETTNITMTLESGLYAATIPVLPYGTAVGYRLYAYDTLGNWRVSEEFSYNVTDVFPPEIGAPEMSPASPSAGESVTVRVSVYEPILASGISKVLLWYVVDWQVMNFQYVNMTSQNGIWEASIPGIDGGKHVGLMIDAVDRAGNRATRELPEYVVEQGATPIAPWPLLLLSSIVVAVFVVGAVFYLKTKRGKRKPRTEEETSQMTRFHV